MADGDDKDEPAKPGQPAGAANPPEPPPQVEPVTVVEAADNGEAIEVRRVDLSNQTAPPGTPPPQTATFNIDHEQEKVRGRIASALVGLLFMIVLLAFISHWWGVNYDELKGLLELIIAPVVALVGSATGFYFGGKKG